MVIGRTKPDGLTYTNTEADWLWLSSSCGKAARFLGYDISVIQCDTKITGNRRSVNGGIAPRMPPSFVAERSRSYTGRTISARISAMTWATERK